ncbi:MAG: D-alanine--D-alanine ligase [Syntrophales bacterium]|nr:D-alanine--D-alanine ligase [Syntrophales bacterium]
MTIRDDKLRVGIIFGGMSSEREVSLNSGRNVYDNLDRDRYEAVPLFMDGDGGIWVLPWKLVSQNTTVDIAERLAGEAERISYEDLGDLINVAFIALHGKYGDDGCIQGLLELLGIPYTGSGVLASALGMDKDVQQRLLKESGIGVPRSIVISEVEWKSDGDAVSERLSSTFGFPLVTKPIREGSSFGVTIIRNPDQIAGGIDAALIWDSEVLVEEYLEGIEFSSIVLEENGFPIPLAVTEIQPRSSFFTYDDKYMPGQCRKFTPPKSIPGEAVETIKSEVVRAFQSLGFRCYGRIDGFYLKSGEVFITDPNSSAGMAPSSFFFEQAAESGMSPSDIISRLVDISISIHAAKQGPL